MAHWRGAFRAAALLIILEALGGAAIGFDFSTVEKSITDFTLDNGMKFIIMEDHSAPVIAFSLMADVGGVNDPKDYTGLAHLFEHMAFKGTSEIGTKNYSAERKALEKLDAAYYALRAEKKKGLLADSAKVAQLQLAFATAQTAADSLVEENEYSNLVDREGGEGMNAGTSYDRTVFFFSLPSNKLELWFYLESSRFSDPVLRELYKEKEVLKEERRMVVESSPIGRLMDEYLHAAFRAFPYGRCLGGEMSEIDNVDPATALAFFHKYYVPSNMIVAMVGDVNPAEVKRLAMKYFGRLPKAPQPEGVAMIEPEQRAERTAVVIDQSQPMLMMGYHRPAASSPDDPVFDVIADYLGGGRTSLLYKRLVKEKKTATTATAIASFPGGKYPNQFLVFIIPSKGVTAPECEAEALVLVERLKNELIPSDELVKIKARAKASLINSMVSRSGMASNLTVNESYLGDWRQLFKGLDRINAVTAEDVQRVAKACFTRENRTKAYIETVADKAEEGK